ncbi:unnamed protein product, partial [Nesidiocoris tenuis]
MEVKIDLFEEDNRKCEHSEHEFVFQELLILATKKSYQIFGIRSRNEQFDTCEKFL